MNQYPKFYVASHRGMVGSAIVRKMLTQGHPGELSITHTHSELDLATQAAVNVFFVGEQPDQVYVTAAKVGGIHANNTYEPNHRIEEDLKADMDWYVGSYQPKTALTSIIQDEWVISLC